MFIFDTERVPETSADLAKAITVFLKTWIQLPATLTPVTIIGDSPAVTSMAIDVTRGQISPENPPVFTKVTGPTTAGPTAKTFTIVGHPVSIAEIPLQLDLSAKNAAFAYGQTDGKHLIATLQDATDGKLSIHISHTDLETGVLNAARHFAGSSVTIQSIEIALTSVSPTELNVLIDITAKKFVTAVVHVSGQIHIDDQLNATATNLKAQADGMVGTIAVGMIQHHLQAIDSTPLPLMTLSLGNVKIREVKIDTADGLQISAAFGSERA